MSPALAELEPLATSPAAYAVAVLLGLLWGSFANVCIYRWPPTPDHPHGRSVVSPGSHCGACNAPVRWYDNVPLLSYLWLRGRCRDCQAPFSARYLLVEALTGALFGVAWWAAVVGPRLWEPFDVRLVRFAIDAGFIFVMVVITFIDLDHQLILDVVTIPAGLVFFGLGLLLPGHRWLDGVIGAAIGYGAVWQVSEAYYWLRGREGLGLGDASMMAVVGALLGWQGVYMSIMLGSVAGVVIVFPAILARGLGAAPPGESAPPTEVPTVDAPGAASAPRDEASGLVEIARAAAVGAALLGYAALVWWLSRRVGPAAVALVFVPPALLRWRSNVLDAAAPEPAHGDPGEPLGHDEPPSPSRIGLVQVPFGPFLAMGAVFYLLGAGWLAANFAVLGG